MHPPATASTGRTERIGSGRRMRRRTSRSTPPNRNRRRRTRRQEKSWTRVVAGSRTGRKLKARTGIRFGPLPSLCRNISLRHREYTGVLSGKTVAAVRPVSTDDARPDALVAQLDRASDSGSEGRGFESSRAHDAKPALPPGGWAFRMGSRWIAADARNRRRTVAETIRRSPDGRSPAPGCSLASRADAAGVSRSFPDTTRRSVVLPVSPFLPPFVWTARATRRRLRPGPPVR